MKDYKATADDRNSILNRINNIFEEGYKQGWNDAVNAHDLMTEEEWQARQEQDADDEIRVGDMVKIDRTNRQFLVYDIENIDDDEILVGFDKDGKFIRMNKQFCYKTGRHILMLKEVLEQMKD